ncbi:hypothetical protein BS47DRAFT_662190 [Hydnum rufescens UP504]|uniref:Uncharacterized protein n=1 Tax=Hydnum rufescens UP504 TaxID=1448309 RepID=A0A9P6B2E6_9AGAM|nr:hypothetical protein BS47DRAFT_662190 [Hydnum rufescens UP504]
MSDTPCTYPSSRRLFSRLVTVCDNILFDAGFLHVLKDAYILIRISLWYPSLWPGCHTIGGCCPRRSLRNYNGENLAFLLAELKLCVKNLPRTSISPLCLAHLTQVRTSWKSSAHFRETRCEAALPLCSHIRPSSPGIKTGLLSAKVAFHSEPRTSKYFIVSQHVLQSRNSHTPHHAPWRHHDRHSPRDSRSESNRGPRH